VTTIPAAKKRKSVPAGSAPKKTTTAKPGPISKPIPNKAISQKRSVSIEEVPDDDDLIPPNPPHNPQSILEHISDEEVDLSLLASDKEPEVLEESEEDDEAELSEYL